MTLCRLLLRHPFSAMLAMTLLTLTAACSSESSSIEQESGAGIHFTTDVTTRALTGPISNTDDLKHSSEGFGVFAYFTDHTLWADKKAADGTAEGQPLTGQQLSFMHNQQVRWGYFDGTERWGYTPLKYWPNASANATPRYISFFAYAPYASTDEVATRQSAPTASGIVALPSGLSLPRLTYRQPLSPSLQTDLLWASRCDATRNGQGLITFSGSTATYQHVPLTFHHALAAIDVYVQREDEPKSEKKDAATKIFVGGLQLQLSSPTAALTSQLDLETGEWSAPSPTGTVPEPAYITYQAEDDFVNHLSGTTSKAQTDVSNIELYKWDKHWNADGTEDTEGTSTTASGVGNVPQQLHHSNKRLMLIPGELTLTPRLTYSFVTRDDALALPRPTDAEGYYTDTEGHHYLRQLMDNVEGNTVTLRLQGGKYYRLVLIIGVTHVTLQVLSVEDWDFPLRFDPSVTDYNEENIPHAVNEEYD